MTSSVFIDVFALQMGPVVKVCMGIEPAFYVDAGRPTFAFNPCGHMATEKTVK
jgi:pellino protein